ncbi:MAG: hypothetical protein Q8Q03_01830 [bacterium]|nr:hypothetical protein [bacterium]
MIRFEEYFSYLYSQFQLTLLPPVLDIIITLSLPVLTILLLSIFWTLWVQYVRSLNFLNLKYTLLEVKLPKETYKSPAAMDLLLHAFHNTSDGKWFNRYWKGETRPWYSLELISVEGRIKFFIWTEDRRKIGAMSALYAQFPGIEVVEVEDYAKSMKYDPKTMKVWAAEFQFANKIPAYPIKTYIDYGLDKDPKEEFKVDPLVPGLEFLGSVGPNQQVWIQILIRAHKDEQKKKGHLFKTTDEWKDGIQEEINKIMIRDPKTKVTGVKDEETGFTKIPMLSEIDEMQVKALSRRLTKLSFDVGIRALYIAKKESFDTPFGIGGCISFFKNFNTEHLNGLRPNGDKWTVSLDSPWKDFMDIRRHRYAREGIMAYKMRSFFYTPFEEKPIVMNTEELATIYHFPGSVSGTPSLERVPSKKGQAPANLPI